MTPYKRREILITQMDQQEAKGISCQGCSGTCCTYEANSMMVTPLEAFELLTYLKDNQLLDQDLKTKCQDTVTKYRLDNALGNGKRSLLRRTYTCPFFHHKELGCPLPREVKPYGCLAFNTHHTEIKTAEFCYSDTALLEQREKSFSWETEKNEQIKKDHNLYWDKLPLPVALLDIWDR